MQCSRTFLPLAILALAACTADQKEIAAPKATSSRAVESASASSSGRYIVASNSGFKGGDLAKTVAALGGTVESIHQGAGFAVVSGLTAEAARQLGGQSGINEVVADAEFSIDQAAPTFEADVTATDGATSQANPTTALRYVWQWNMRLIKANKAWAANKLGSPSVTVAILDSGIDYDTPDMNGLVDLSRSASFVPSDDALAATYFPTRNKITDFNGHGTNVASQVSSKAFALAGVTSRTTLIGVKVLSRTGSGSTSGVLNGIAWAADHGANVANMSLGSTFNKNVLPGFHSLFNKVFNYAKGKGMVIVVSAGNEGTDLQHNGNEYKAYCDAPHVICVSAVGPALASQIGTALEDSPAYYTNFGRQALDIAAPGGNADAEHGFALSLWPWGNDIASWVWSYCPKNRIASFTTAGVPVTPCAAGNRLSGYIGTSQASPHVAGLAALLVAEYGANQPEKVKTMIQKSADDINPLLGRGRINVAKAVGLE